MSKRHSTCVYYKQIPGKKRGYCTNPLAYYYGLQVYGWNRAADRCYKQGNKKREVRHEEP